MCIHRCEVKNHIHEERGEEMIRQDQNYFNRTLMRKHISGPDTENHKNDSNSSTLCTQSPKKNKEPPQRSSKFCYREKNPMAWGIPK